MEDNTAEVVCVGGSSGWVLLCFKSSPTATAAISPTVLTSETQVGFLPQSQNLPCQEGIQLKSWQDAETVMGSNENYFSVIKPTFFQSVFYICLSYAHTYNICICHILFKIMFRTEGVFLYLSPA